MTYLADLYRALRGESLALQHERITTMIKLTLIALACTLALAGCSTTTTSTGTVQEPSQATMTALQTGVTMADSLGFAYENLPSTTSGERVQTEDAITSINSAWASLQAGVKAGQPVEVSTLEAAISALEAFASPRAVTADFTKADAARRAQ